MSKQNISSTKSSKWDRAVLAVLEHPTREQAAAALGIHPTTLWRWTQKWEFQQALLRAQRQASSTCVARVQQASAPAVETLFAMLTDKDAPAGARVRAAQAILHYAHKSMESDDLEFRVSRLESYIKNVETTEKN